MLVNRDKIVTAALRLIGVLRPNQVASSDSIETGQEALNLLIQSWVADGLQLWVLKAQLHPLTADTQSYTVGLSGNIAISRPDKIDTIIYRDAAGTYDRPLERLTRNEYYSLSSKQTKGVPVSFFYDSQLTNGVLYLWPYPLTVTTEKILIIYQKPFDYMDLAADTFEFPDWYFNAIKWGLAYQLCQEYEVTPEKFYMIRSQYEEEKNRVMEYDQEQGSLFFQPESIHYRGI